MSVIHTPRKPELDLRVVVFPGTMFTLLGILFLRLWYFQVVKSAELVERAEATREQHVDKLAPRGLILDRNGERIASVHPAIVVTGIYNVLRKNDWVVDRLASMLNTDAKKIRAKVYDARRTPNVAVPIYVGADEKVGTQIAEASNDLPGVGIDTAPMRAYSDGVSFAHVLGYVGLPSERDVKRLHELGKEPAQFVGKGGLEQAYETDLMGEPGSERMEVDAKRRPIRIVGRDNPVPGNELILSLDADLQRYATQLMKEKGFAGAVVALDPKTGEVLCMVSAPTYDGSLFLGGISQAEYDKIQDDPNHPFLPRALQSVYSPGSTFKIVTSLAAYEHGVFSTTQPVYCSGGYHLGKRVFHCLGHHGSITFARAMAKSCNTFFMTWGARLGEDAIRQAALEVGLGHGTGIDIGGEYRGVVPTRDWFENRFGKYHWYGGDTLNLSIGQGQLSATPLQMASVASLVANEGVSYRPHLVRAIRDVRENGKERLVPPEVIHKVAASPEFWQAMKGALNSVIDEGTAGSARIPNVEWAGKTGSTEHGHDKKTHGWFVGFAPLDNPKIAISVLVEQGGHGGEVAAPIAREIVQRYLNKSHAKAAAKVAAASSISAASAGTPKVR